MSTARFIFLDIETTGLRAGVDQITEIAWITDDGVEEQYIVEHDRLPGRWVLENTDYLTRIALAEKVGLPFALERLNRTCRHMRWASADATLARHGEEAPHIDVYMVGACPAFDDRFLRAAYVANGVPEPAPPSSRWTSTRSCSFSSR